MRLVYRNLTGKKSYDNLSKGTEFKTTLNLTKGIPKIRGVTKDAYSFLKKNIGNVLDWIHELFLYKNDFKRGKSFNIKNKPFNGIFRVISQNDKKRFTEKRIEKYKVDVGYLESPSLGKFAEDTTVMFKHGAGKNFKDYKGGAFAYIWIKTIIRVLLFTANLGRYAKPQDLSKFNKFEAKTLDFVSVNLNDSMSGVLSDLHKQSLNHINTHLELAIFRKSPSSDKEKSSTEAKAKTVLSPKKEDAVILEELMAAAYEDDEEEKKDEAIMKEIMTLAYEDDEEESESKSDVVEMSEEDEEMDMDEIIAKEDVPTSKEMEERHGADWLKWS